MSKFYFTLWLKWLIRVSACSLVLAASLSLFITLIIYIKQGMLAIDSEVASALFQVFAFWFPIFLSVTLLIALFRALKYIFNVKIYGYELKLLECNSSEVLEDIGYGDLIKVWRKWFMLIIWLVGIQMIIAIAYTHFFTLYTGIMDWFNIYYLAFFIFLAGYFSFIILGSKCKRVRLIKC